MNIVKKFNRWFAPSISSIEEYAWELAEQKFRIVRKDGVDYILFEGNIMTFAEDKGILDRLYAMKKRYAEDNIERQKKQYGY